MLRELERKRGAVALEQLARLAERRGDRRLALAHGPRDAELQDEQLVEREPHAAALGLLERARTVKHVQRVDLQRQALALLQPAGSGSATSRGSAARTSSRSFFGVTSSLAGIDGNEFGVLRTPARARARRTRRDGRPDQPHARPAESCSATHGWLNHVARICPTGPPHRASTIDGRRRGCASRPARRSSLDRRPPRPRRRGSRSGARRRSGTARARGGRAPCAARASRAARGSSCHAGKRVDRPVEVGGPNRAAAARRTGGPHRQSPSGIGSLLRSRTGVEYRTRPG